MSKCRICGQEINTPKGLVNIKELNIKVETEIHHKGEELKNIKIPKGFRLLKVNEIIFLHNNKNYKRLVGKEDPELIQIIYDIVKREKEKKSPL